MAKSKGKRLRAAESASEPKTSKKKKLAANFKSYQDGSLFSKTVEAAGLTLMGGDAANVLNVDQVIFQRNLQKALKKNTSVTEVVNEFLEGLQTYIEEEARFKHSLLRTISSPECESARSGQQDSLIRLLLNIEELQPPLINLLLEKLPEFLDEDNESVFDHPEGSNLPKMILSQFYWLDKIVNAKDMTVKMLEMIEVSSLAVQKDIISCIPEVITDDEHNGVAIKLKELMEQSSELIVSILNALNNLNVMPELLKEVCRSAMQTLNSANLEDLPVIVKFILRTVTPSTALEIIQELRENLDFTSSQACLNENQRKFAEDSELILLDTIRSNVQFNKTIAAAWMKAIEVVIPDEQLGLEDLFVMLMFHGMAPHKKPVEGLFRKKIRDDTLSVEVVEKSFEGHPKVMRNYFTSLLDMAGLLIRSPEPLLSAFATALYKEAFLAFDIHYKQAVIGALVNHIGGTNDIERDASLNFLLELVDISTKEVATFAIFLKKNLEDLHKFSLPQVRKIFAILSGLTFGDEGQEATIQDELHNFVRKQLTGSDVSYKRIGVIAALTIFKKMALKRSDGKPCSDARFKQITSLLKLVQSSCRDSPEVVGLFCDEISDIVVRTKLDNKVQDWIGETVLNDFQEDYVVDIVSDEQLTDEFGLPMADRYSLQAEDSQNDIAINLLPLISKSAKQTQKKASKKLRVVSPICLAPQFRLLQVCIKAQNDGGLEDIDALVGCPLYTFKTEVIDKLDSLSAQERELACACIVGTLNWFREVLNAFAISSNPELKAKVIGRVQDITELEAMLEKCLAVTPGYKPNIATFDVESSPDIKGAGPSTSGRGKTGAKKKRKKPGQDKENLTADDTGVSSSQLDDEESEKDALTLADVRVDIKGYRGFFRELDLDVFHILGCGLLTKRILDSDHHTAEVQLLQLQPSQLEFLLGDLLEKTKHSLTTKKVTHLQVKSKSSFGFSRLDQLSPNQVAKKLIKFLQSLAQHLEATHTSIQALTTQNDGLVDGPGSDSADALKMKSCFQLILEILLTFFSWDGLRTKNMSSLLEEALTVFATKETGSGQSSVKVKQLSKKSCQFFQKFSSSVPNLECGVVLLSLLRALTDIQGLERNDAIGALSETFLKRDWLDHDGERCKGAKHNEALQKVIRFHLCHSGDDTIQAIEAICTDGVPELMNAGKNGASTTYPTLTQSSFPSFYRIMFEELVSYQKSIPGFSTRDPMDAQGQKLIDWNVSVRVMYVLINLIKAFDARTNLTTALKYGKASIEVFMRNGMPAMDLMFKTQRGDVQSLLKNLQQSTRILQYMCNHTKVAQDIALTNHVPALKRILEQFVYRVKAMLVLHNCHQAFWLGTLKNKDLKGEEISSQICREEEDESEDEEETVEGGNSEGSEEEDDDESERPDEGNDDDGVSCSEDY